MQPSCVFTIDNLRSIADPQITWILSCMLACYMMILDFYLISIFKLFVCGYYLFEGSSSPQCSDLNFPHSKRLEKLEFTHLLCFDLWFLFYYVIKTIQFVYFSGQLFPSAI